MFKNIVFSLALLTPCLANAGVQAIQNASPNAITGTGSKCFSVDDPTFVVDCNLGRVGIGVAAPDEVLHVVGGVNPRIKLGGTSGSPGYILDGTTADAGIFNVSGNGDISLHTGDALTQRMTILTANGNVGIGTASPGRTLDVNGAGVVRGAFDVVGGTTTFYYGGDNKIDIDGLGSGSQAAVIYSVGHVNKWNTGMNNFATGELYEIGRPGASAALTIDRSDRVGINTASPCSTCTLHVAGGASVTGALNVGNAAAPAQVSLSSGTGANGTAVFKFGMTSLADDATLALETNYGTGGVLTVQALGATSNATCIFRIKADSNTAVVISDPDTLCAVTDADTKISVIVDGDSTYTLKNRLGGAENFAVQFLGR